VPTTSTTLAPTTSISTTTVLLKDKTNRYQLLKSKPFQTTTQAPLRKESTQSPPYLEDTSNGIVFIAIPLIFMVILFILCKRRRSVVRPSNVILRAKPPSEITPVTDKVDPVISDIQDKADLENQLRKNAFKMFKIHREIQRKGSATNHFKKNAILMRRATQYIAKSVDTKNIKKAMLLPCDNRWIKQIQSQTPRQHDETLEYMKQNKVVQRYTAPEKTDVSMLDDTTVAVET
jgi:hypothetical protein